MHIGRLIRYYRKKNQMTKKEMATCLAVTAPTIKKWEKGLSQPDILLIAPIAKLFHITTDTLLAGHEELSVEEIKKIISNLNEKFKTATYDETFNWAKKKIEQYSNCESLMWQLAVLLDAWRLFQDVSDKEKYDDYIKDCYIKVLNSENPKIKYKAADLLYNFYIREENYEKATEFLKYFSDENPEKKRKQALIYSKTNRQEEAYQIYEELLFSGYQTMSMVLQSISFLAMQDQQQEKSYLLLEKQIKLAKIFEMGKFQVLMHELELATAQQDVDATITTMEKILENGDNLYGFTKSSIFEHMKFGKPSTHFLEVQYQNLLSSFNDDENYKYMKNDKRFAELVKRIKK
jgi:transcriptional regulator with XRE-family HTH domain